MIMRATLGQFEFITEQIKAKLQTHIAELLKQKEIILNIEGRINSLLSMYSSNIEKLKVLQVLYGKLTSYKTQQGKLETKVNTIYREVGTGTTPTVSASIDVAKLAVDINVQVSNVSDLNRDVTNIETGISLPANQIPTFLVNAFIIGAITVIISAIAGGKHKYETR